MMETNLDFYILPNTSTDKFVVIDSSTYLEAPETPLFSITLPGFSKPITIPFQPSRANLLNTSMLGTSVLGQFNCFDDGVYKFTYSICPNDEQYITKYHLVDASFKSIYASKYLGYLENSCTCSDKNTELLFQEIDLYITAAHLEVERNNPIKATKYYRRAVSLVNKIKCI